MSKVATTIRIEAELRASLNKICVRTGDQTYHIEQALRAYGPIKKLANKVARTIADNAVTAPPAVFEKPNDSGFDEIWDMYGKKGNSKTSRIRFGKLSDTEKLAVYNHVPAYVLSTPDKQFRKGFESYITKECWNDEITQSTAVAPIESFVEKHTNKSWHDEIDQRDDLLSDEG